MGELLAAAVRGLVVSAVFLVQVLDLQELWERRQRRKRLASLARGETVDIYCVLTDPLLTVDVQREGKLSVGKLPVKWHAKGDPISVEFRPGPLTMVAVDKKAVTFRSEDGRTELRDASGRRPARAQGPGRRQRIPLLGPVKTCSYNALPVRRWRPRA